DLNRFSSIHPHVVILLLTKNVPAGLAATEMRGFYSKQPWNCGKMDTHPAIRSVSCREIGLLVEKNFPASSRTVGNFSTCIRFIPLQTRPLFTNQSGTLIAAFCKNSKGVTYSKRVVSANITICGSRCA